MTWLLFVLTMLGPGAVEAQVGGRFDTFDDCHDAAMVVSARLGVFATCERDRDA